MRTPSLARARSDGAGTWRLVLALVLVLVSSLATLTARADDPPLPCVANQPEAAPIDSACAPALRWLLDHQRADGSFGASTTRLQTTAFVVIALSDDDVAPRTPAVERALRRSVEFLVSRQTDAGAFVEGGVDHTVLALLALLALRDEAPADGAALARAALPLLPRAAREALGDPGATSDDAALVRAAWALAHPE